MHTQRQTIHAITNLKAYYDCQLLNICRMIEELVGVDCNAIKLIMKVIPIVKYFIHTGYEISKGWYSGIWDSITRIG